MPSIVAGVSIYVTACAGIFAVIIDTRVQVPLYLVVARPV